MHNTLFRERPNIPNTEQLVRLWLEANKFKDLDTLAKDLCKEFLHEK